jgi:hypothetical protein
MVRHLRCVYIDQKLGFITFRSLIKRFTRYRREDRVDPLQTAKEPEFQGRLISLYLLGLDCRLALSKRQQKVALDQLAHSQRNRQQDDVLRELFRAGSQPRVRAEWLEKELKRISADLPAFRWYREIELQAGALAQRLRQI